MNRTAMAWERTGFTLLILLIQSILVGLKLDDVIKSSWWAVFVPAYIWVVVVAVIVLAAWYNLSGKTEEYEEHWLSAARTAYFAVLLLIVIVFVVLLAVRAEEGSHSIPWPVVFIPLYVYQGVLLILLIYQCSQYRLLPDAHQGMYAWIQWFWILNLFVWGSLLLILLAIKLDGGLSSWNYWAVLSPLWVLLVISALLFISVLPLLLFKQLQLELWKACFYVATYTAAVVFMVFLTLRADTTVHWDWSIVFIPLYITQALLLLYVTAEWLQEPTASTKFAQRLRVSSSDF